MTARAVTKADSGHISVEQFYQAQIETNKNINALELRLISHFDKKFSELESCLPTAADVKSAEKLAKLAYDRVIEVDRKTNWFGGLNAIFAAAFASIAAYWGSK